MTTQSHNPDNLTEWGQSEGWRLLTVEERSNPLPMDTQFFSRVERDWRASRQRGEVSDSNVTYRTREPLPSQPDDDLSYYETELPKVIAAARRGEKWEIMWMEVPPEERKWTIPMEDTLEFLYDQIESGQYRVRLAPVPVVKPWTFNTRPREIVWVFKKGYISDRLITAWKDDGVEVGNYAFVTYGDLLADWLQRDGSPCGDCVKPEGGK